ncbi:MAG: DUF2927 domain-containing protein, partial [Bacteroidota bacterium]
IKLFVFHKIPFLLINSLFILSIFLISCGDSEDVMEENNELDLLDLSVTVPNKPASGTTVGKVSIVTTGVTNPVYEIVSQSIDGAMQINSTTGDITIADATPYEFKVNPVITAEISVTAGELQGTAMVTVNVDEITTAQMEIIEYFVDVANRRANKAARNTVRWEQDMNLFIIGDPGEALLDELNSVVSEINALITSDVRINIVDNIENSNAEIFFGSPQGFIDHYVTTTIANSIPLEDLQRSYGLHVSGSELESGFVFTFIYVDTENTTDLEKNHLMREQVARALGLAGPSTLYTESIFFENILSDYNEFSDLDKELIRLLYSPRMNLGLNAVQSAALLKSILGDEN